MEDELWLKKIKERLEDYAEPMPDAGWERLEKALPVSGSPMFGRRWAVPFRRWAVAAAAGLLVAVSSVSLWLLQSPIGDEVRQAETPALAVVPDALPRQSAPLEQNDEVNESPLYRAYRHSSVQGGLKQEWLAQQREIPAEEQRAEKTLPTVSEENTSERAGTNDAEMQLRAAESQQADGQEARRAKRYRSSGKKDNLHLSVERSSNKSVRKGWSVGVGIGNAGSVGNLLGNAGDWDNQLMDDASPNRFDLLATTDAVLPIPEGQELVFKNGFPYLQKKQREVRDVKHKQPLNFALSVRKNLARGFSVESGLTYTYLASDVWFTDGSGIQSQKLHYIGIPIRGNWNFVDNNSLTMYLSAGGTVEKCVYGRVGNEKNTVKPLQLSAMGAVGVQYNVNKRVGLYVEPGVSYFFDDGSDVQTIRKENPCRFTLQAGMRLTY